MRPFSLNIHGRLRVYTRTAVMGIINVTPDSFYASSRAVTADEIGRRAAGMVSAGADMLDIGAYSTRPGAAVVSEEEEMERLRLGLRAVRDAVGDDMPVSVDTFRASVARMCVEELGADIINDISGGTLDKDMFVTVAGLRVPYILMHTRGTPADMQQHAVYGDVVADVIGELSRSLWQLDELGVSDVIVDPGFGFAKTMEQNYRMLARLDAFAMLGRPVLVGVSRKSMFSRLLGIDAASALVPTAVAGALAVERGASILRVHDVEAARQSIAIIDQIEKMQ